jgi:hypothetical protein
MNTAQLLSTLFSMALTFFLIRWGVNWVLLNRINKTDYFSFNTKYSFQDFFPIVKHMAISEFKFWWFGKDHTKLKLFSNILSGLTYSSLILVIAMIVLIVL